MGTERERLVFVDETARRHRLILGIGAGLATLAALWLAALLAGAFGLRDLPLIALPDGAGGHERRAATSDATGRPKFAKPGEPAQGRSDSAEDAARKLADGRSGEEFGTVQRPRALLPRRTGPSSDAPTGTPTIPPQPTSAPSLPGTSVTRTHGGGLQTDSSQTYTPSGRVVPDKRSEPSPAGSPSPQSANGLERRPASPSEKPAP